MFFVQECAQNEYPAIPVVTLHTNGFNIQNFQFLQTGCIYGFCMVLRADSNILQLNITPRPRFDPRPVLVRFVLDKEAPREIFLKELPFSPASTLPSVLHSLFPCQYSSISSPFPCQYSSTSSPFPFPLPVLFRQFSIPFSPASTLPSVLHSFLPC